MDRSGKRAAWIACTLLIAASLSTHAADDPQPVIIDAVWKPQTVSFAYRSEGRTYNCSVLEHKITGILRRLGAREGVRLHRDSCRDLDQYARYEISLQSPVAATAGNIGQLTDHDSKDVLIARIQGSALPSAADLPHFPATWESISLRRGNRVHLDAGDCALVQQLRNQVLPQMSVRVTRDIRGADCALESQSFVLPQFTVVALVPVSEER